MRNIQKSALMLLMLLCASVAGAQPKGPSLMGTDFWVGFISSQYYYIQCIDCSHSLLIASEEFCTAYIECQSPAFDTIVDIIPGSITRVALPAIPNVNVSGLSQYDYGFHVSTTAPAVVYAFIVDPYHRELSSVLPTATLGYDYMVQSYGAKQEICIVAPYDNTDVQIITGEDDDNTVFVMLQSGEVYYQMDEWGLGDLSGTRIVASNPVAVFQGACGDHVPYIPFDGVAMPPGENYLYEQSFPIESWGRRFIVMPSVRYSTNTSSFIGDLVKITAGDDNCVVNIGGQLVDTLAAGESYTCLLANHTPTGHYLAWAGQYDFYQADALCVETSKPATTCIYLTGSHFGGDPGGPASVVVPPLEQTISHSVIANQTYWATDIYDDYINLVALTADVPLITIDGRNIASSFTPLSNGYSWARIAIDEGRPHVIDALTGQFQATVYHPGAMRSCAYIACAAVHDFSYYVHADRNDLCLGDTATVNVSLGSALLHSKLQLDGQPLGTDMNNVRLAFDGEGVHRLEVIITPLGDTVRETFTVHPVYSSLQHDTLCPGESLRWRGRMLDSTGYYADSLFTAARCDSVLALQLTVLDAPQADFVVDTDCVHYCYHILAITECDATGYGFVWRASPPDGALEGQPWDSLSLSPTQFTTYSFSIAGRCPSDTSFALHPIQWPVAQMEVLPEHLSVDHPSFEAYDQSQSADSRQWWINRQLKGEEPVLYYTADALEDSLLLTLVAANEVCTDTLTRVIYIDHAVVWVPNAFTPEGLDNRLFAPVLNECAAEELYIYNRQGLLVAHIEGDNPSWDGTHDGIPAPQGAYLYTLHYRTHAEPLRLQKAVGTVILLR